MAVLAVRSNASVRCRVRRVRRVRLGLGLLVFQQPLDELVGTIHISVAGNGLRCVSKEQKRVGRKPTN